MSNVWINIKFNKIKIWTRSWSEINFHIFSFTVSSSVQPRRESGEEAEVCWRHHDAILLLPWRLESRADEHGYQLRHSSSYLHQGHHSGLTSSMMQMKWWWSFLINHHTFTRGITLVWPPVWCRWSGDDPFSLIIIHPPGASLKSDLLQYEADEVQWWWWWYLTLILKSVPGASETDVVTMTLDTHHHTYTRGITDIWHPPVWGRWYLTLIIILAWPPSMRQMEWWWWHLAWRWRYISKSCFVIKESQQLIQLFPSLHSWVPWESGLRWYQTHNKLVHLSNCKVQNTGECVYI